MSDAVAGGRRNGARRVLPVLVVPLAAVALACGPREGVGPGDWLTPAPSLVPGQALVGEAGGPWPHRYEVVVPAGHYLRVVATQRGLDVGLRLVTPEGEVGPTFDSPTGAEGEEPAYAVAAAAGTYGVIVDLAGDDEPGGRYEIVVADLRPASERDRLRVEAEVALAVAEDGRRAARPGRAADYLHALRLAAQLADDRLRAYVHLRLGDIALARDAREAERHQLRTIELAAAAGDLGLEAFGRNRLSHSLRRMGRLEEALAEQRRALEGFRRLDDRAAAAETLGAIGSSLHLLGLVADALAAFDEALTICRELGDEYVEAGVRLQHGETLLSLGKLDEAADQLAVAARLAGEGHGEDGAAARAERGLGAVRSRRGDTAGALEHFARALRHARADDLPALVAVTLADLATARLRRNEIDAARQAIEEGLEIARRLGDESYEAAMLNKLAQCHHAAGEHAESARLHAAAAEKLARLGDPVALASARYGLARALLLAGRPREGLAELEKGLDAAEEVRRAVGGYDLQAAYLGSKPHYRELHVDLWMELHAREPAVGHDLAALLADDRGRMRSLVDLIGGAEGAEADAGAAPAGDRAALLASFRRLRQIAGHLEMAAGDGEALAEVRRRQREVLLRLDRARGGGRGERADEALPERPLTSERIEELRGDSLVLVYSLGERRSFVWVLGENGRRVEVLPARREIDFLARRLAEGMASRHAAQAAATADAAAELSARLLAPVAADLRGHRRIAVVPDGALHLVPFAALPDPAAPERPLVAEHEVVTVPSLSTLDRLRRRSAAPRRWRGEVAVIADPVFAADDSRVAGAAPGAPPPPAPPGLARAAGAGAGRFPRLQGTRREAEALLGLVPADAAVFRGFDFAADREAVLGGALDGYRIVHIATHGVLDAHAPGGAGLVFSLVDEAGRPRDGHLQLEEVYGLNLNAEVIVLSACESGTGRDMEGEGLIGLSRGFLEAGAQSLVVSLWQVGDRGAAELMERFYRAWLVDGEPPPAALARAQRSMWSEPTWSDPYHWAAFQLVGDWQTSAAGKKDEPIEKKTAGTPQEPTKPDEPLPGPGRGKPPQR